MKRVLIIMCVLISSMVFGFDYQKNKEVAGGTINDNNTTHAEVNLSLPDYSKNAKYSIQHKSTISKLKSSDNSVNKSLDRKNIMYYIP
jgi:hypothetical protein